MRLLAVWDDASEAELIRMYLGVDGAEVSLTTDVDEFLELARSRGDWDAVLLTTSQPDHDRALEIFLQVRELHPGTPIVAASQPGEVYRLATYLTSGLRSYLIRDANGDFMFLIHAVIVGAVKQVEADRERLVAEKLRREIDSVRQLQESIIPHQISCPESYSIAARYESSQIRVIGGQPVTMAGGDYYDAFTLPDNSVIVLVGDASGHGMKACMSIMTMHTIIRMIRYDEFRDPARFVAHVNKVLCGQQLVQNEGGFITLLYGVLNPATGEFRWASAGHPNPILHRLGDDSFEFPGNDGSTGLPIGILDEVDYETQTAVLPANSRLMLYTDGIIEAFPSGASQHEEFGLNGIQQTLSSCRGATLEQTLQQLFDDSHAFTQGQGRHDDTSVVLLERC
ncbi:MAG: Phosphoserine phosphatase RsbU [Planctomycetota bacterium]|jgi:serine phosphatase RsbU (regulator of sigma subunit)